MPTGDERSARLRELIDALADEDADGLLAQAREQARARVLETLTDALAESMLERAAAGRRDRPSAPPRDRPSAPPPRDPAKEAPAWYVFGVIAAGDAGRVADLPGIEPGRPAELLAEGELAAVVSHVRLEDFDEERLREHLADMDWVEATARAHERTLDLLCRRATVIPMRMCSVYRSEDGVREMLRREREAFLEGLAELDGKAEWGVKVFADLRLARTAASDAPAAEDTRAGTAYLARKREERDAAERASQVVEHAAQQIHARLSAAAADGRVLAPQQAAATGHAGDMVLNGVYLVSDDEQRAFDTRVAELRETFGPIGLELVQTGPWPAYNFVPGTIGAAW